MGDSEYVEDIDHGWDRIVKQLDSIKDGAYVAVGVLSDSSTWAADAPANLADIATFNEFGAPQAHIPSRPFMRQSFDKNISAITRFQELMQNDVYLGNKTEAEALDALGVFFKGKVQGIFRSGSFKANAPSTIRQKNRSKIKKAKRTIKKTRSLNKRGVSLSSKQLQSFLGAKETVNLGGTTPLIDTGRLRQSIHYEVVFP